MQLSEALRLVRKVDPEAIKHRDHICSESVTHDLARCPKMLSQIYAWRVESNTLPKPISRVQSARDFREEPGEDSKGHADGVFEGPAGAARGDG